MENEIRIVNKLIAQAVMHGADYGGSYHSNEKGLVSAMEDWLNFKGITDKYTVKEIKVIETEEDVCGIWHIHQIVEK